MEKMREQDFDVNSFRAGTATSDVLQLGGCLAVCCLLLYQDPEFSCKMVVREGGISGRGNLGHHTAKPVRLSIVSKDRAGKW